MVNVICRWCNLKDTPKEEMEFELVGQKRPVKKYYHEECFKLRVAEKEFQAKEQAELDELVVKIEEIFSIKRLPTTCYPALQDLRNGTKFYGKTNYKYKEGYTYDLISETFEYVSDSIEWALANRDFNGFTASFKYCLAIVCDKLNTVELRREKQKKARKAQEAHLKSIKDEEEFKTSYKKKQDSSRSIADFLDD